LAVYVAASVASGDFAITTAGSVGIGTAAPDATLSIRGPASATPGIGTINLGLAGDRSYWAIRQTGSADLAIDSYVSSWSNILTIGRQTGNVGIGNTAPGLPLDVKAPHAGGPAASGVTQTGVLRLSQGDGAAVLDMGINVTTGAGWLQGTVSNSLGSTLPILLNPNGGNVGVGTASPGQKLDVNGNINAAGSVTATAFFYSSDARLKKNVEAIASSGALQKILALQPVTYNWIDPAQPTTTQLGFIAQQVEQIVPELVTTNASTTLKAVDYARVTPLLVGAAQAQQAQIDAQQKEIDALVAEVAALKAGK
jgi:trimeric autotransporter adhesin